jgi:hypothetical protein
MAVGVGYSHPPSEDWPEHRLLYFQLGQDNRATRPPTFRGVFH